LTDGPRGLADDRLRQLETRLLAIAAELEAKRDSRCVFAHTYSLMTRRIAEGLPDAPGVDATWITDLAESFGQRYVVALTTPDDELPPAWRHAFEVMRDKRTSVLEDLLFGMTVHIVHDLPLTLGDVSPGRTPPASHLYDFHAMNELLASAIEPIIDATARRYGRYVKWLDRLGGQYDNLLTDYGIRMARGLAWYNAQRLADPRSAERARAAVEASPIELIDSIAKPQIASVRAILRFARWIVSFLRTWPKPDDDRGMDIRAE
jgi:hypothetical protein